MNIRKGELNFRDQYGMMPKRALKHKKADGGWSSGPFLGDLRPGGLRRKHEKQHVRQHRSVRPLCNKGSQHLYQQTMHTAPGASMGRWTSGRGWSRSSCIRGKKILSAPVIVLGRQDRPSQAVGLCVKGAVKSALSARISSQLLHKLLKPHSIWIPGPANTVAACKRFSLLGRIGARGLLKRVVHCQHGSATGHGPACCRGEGDSTKRWLLVYRAWAGHGGCSKGLSIASTAVPLGMVLHVERSSDNKRISPPKSIDSPGNAVTPGKALHILPGPPEEHCSKGNTAATRRLCKTTNEWWHGVCSAHAEILRVYAYNPTNSYHNSMQRLACRQHGSATGHGVNKHWVQEALLHQQPLGCSVFNDAPDVQHEEICHQCSGAVWLWNFQTAEDMLWMTRGAQRMGMCYSCYDDDATGPTKALRHPEVRVWNTAATGPRMHTRQVLVALHQHRNCRIQHHAAPVYYVAPYLQSLVALHQHRNGNIQHRAAPAYYVAPYLQSLELYISAL
eukprot:scaffold128331_cov22-Tisochrysis_lutea.AAC.1